MQEDAIRLRDNATEDRIELGNELYKKIVELFDFGKDYWITRDEAKYNDYIISDTPSGSNTAVREADVPAGATLNIDVEEVPFLPDSVVTTVVTLSALKFYASATEAGEPIDVIYELPIGTAENLYTEYEDLTGIDPGTNFLTVRNTGAVTAHYKITFSNLAE